MSEQNSTRGVIRLTLREQVGEVYLSDDAPAAWVELDFCWLDGGDIQASRCSVPAGSSDWQKAVGGRLIEEAKAFGRRLGLDCHIPAQVFPA